MPTIKEKGKQAANRLWGKAAHPSFKTLYSERSQKKPVSTGMKIAQIISHSYPSGASHFVLLFSCALQQKGHEVILFCPAGEWLPAKAREAGIEVQEMSMRSRTPWVELRQAARLLRESRTEIIHTHTTRGAMHGFLLSLFCPLPVAASVHTYSRDLLYSRLIPQGRNRVVAVSNFVRDALIKKGAPASHVETIYNGTDYLSPDTSSCSKDTTTNAALECQETSPAVRTELNLPPEALLVGVFGYISELKGQEILALAAPQTAAHCPRVHFVLVGPLVSPEIQKRIIAQGEKDGIAHRLHLLGYRSDVKRLMDAMNIVVVPSQIEACSMVTLEAMARGKPVLAARVGGMPELVLHNETGLLVERKSEDFAEALIRLLKDPILCARMGAAGRQRVAEHFTSSHLTSQFEALYHKMTSPVGRRQA